MEYLRLPGVQILLWVGAVLGLVWMTVPSLMIALGRRRIDVDVSDDPLEAEPRGDDPAYEKKFRQLAARGYRAAGKTVEHARFFTPMHWSWRSDGSRYLAAPDGTTYVSLHRIAGADPLRTAASTIFEGGGMVVTSTPVISAHNRDAEVMYARGNYRAESIGDLAPAGLLAAHAERVKEFSEDRKLSVKKATLREVAAESLDLGRRVMSGGTGGLGGVGIYMLVGMAVGMSMMLPNIGWKVLPIVPVMICAATGFFALMRWVTLPGRIPLKVRLRVMMGLVILVAVGGMAAVSWLPGRMVARALDRIDADARNGGPADVDSVVRRGPGACRPVVDRYADAATQPETRRVLHDVLVKMNGSDLGPEPGAWNAWCAEAERDRR